jgi:hypothetical protein
LAVTDAFDQHVLRDVWKWTIGPNQIARRLQLAGAVTEALASGSTDISVQLQPLLDSCATLAIYRMHLIAEFVIFRPAPQLTATKNLLLEFVDQSKTKLSIFDTKSIGGRYHWWRD